MKRHITTMIAAAAISLIMAVPAMADWAQVSTNVWQWTENGVAVKDRWVTTQNGLYYINLDGNCSYGWINWCGNWYYGEPSGANLGNVVRNNWAQIDNSYYYFFEDGRMATGTQVIGGVTYTFDANGHCTTTPAGVNILTFSAAPAVVSGGSGVYYGGGSGSGGSSSGGSTTPSGTAEAEALESVIDSHHLDILKAVDGVAGVSGAVADDNVVTMTVYSRVSEDTEAATLIDAAMDAVNASGIDQSQIKSVSFNTLTAGSVSEMQSRVKTIIGSHTIAELRERFPDTDSVTVNMSDGTTLIVNVRF